MMDEALADKCSLDELTEDEWALIDEYEYGQQWVERDDELREMSLAEFDEWKRTQDYGLTDDDLDNEDW